MNKGLEALEMIKEQYECESWYDDEFDSFELLDIIEKELKDYEKLRQVIDEDTERDLKALRMIREKHISLALIDATTSHKQYNACIDESIEPLTAQEYSFIEEVLK